MVDTKQFQLLDLKTGAEEGTFEGIASSYGVLDSHNDVVMRGAFDRTIKENRGRIVVLADHDTTRSVGIATLHDTPSGLRIKGKLLLDLADARDAYARVKNGLVTGISIGYQTVRESFQGTKRLLHDVDLFECSLVTFPACPTARIESVKSDRRLFADIWRSLDETSDEAALDALRTLIRDMKHDAINLTRRSS